MMERKDQSDPLPQRFAQRFCVEDLQIFARIFREELDANFVAALQAMDFPRTLALLPSGIASGEDGAWGSVIPGSRAVIDSVELKIDQLISDQASEHYADALLLGRCGGAPEESYWTDRDHLRRQEAYLEIHRMMKYYGMGHPEDSRMPADHIAIELEILSWLLDPARHLCQDAAHFLDNHILNWLGQFSNECQRHCPENLYTLMLDLLHGYLIALQECLQTFCVCQKTSNAKDSQYTWE